MFKFPSINQFRHVVQHVRQQAQFKGLDAEGNAIMDRTAIAPTLAFLGTVKMHGTNAAIVFHPDNTITFQSRERVLVPGDDNAGFAGYFSQHTEALQFQKRMLMRAGMINPEDTIMIYGEWCGGNIQKGVALSELPKMFVVFAVKVNDNWRHELVHTVYDHNICIRQVEQFPKWFINIDFENPERSQNLLSELTMAVEKECPVGKHFGVSGIGEGIVWRCIEKPTSDLWFKVKGEKHSASKVKTLATVDTEAIESIKAFVDSVVTEARLEQGLQNLINEQKKPFSINSIGDFIRWVHNDVMKEEADTIQANGFDHKKLGSPIAIASKRWYIQKLDEQAMA
jgi:hypothetical protein